MGEKEQKIMPKKRDLLAIVGLAAGSVLIAMWFVGITTEYVNLILSEDPPGFLTGFYRGYFWFIYPVITFFQEGHELVSDVRTNQFMWGFIIGVIQSGYLLFWLVRLVFERRAARKEPSNEG